MEIRFPTPIAGAARHTFVTPARAIETTLLIVDNEPLVEATSILDGMRLGQTSRTKIRTALVPKWAAAQQEVYRIPRGSDSSESVLYLTIPQLREAIALAGRRNFLTPKRTQLYLNFFALPACLEHWQYAFTMTRAEMRSLMLARLYNHKDTWGFFEAQEAEEEKLASKAKVSAVPSSAAKLMTSSTYSFKPIEGLASFEKPLPWEGKARKPAPEAPTYSGLGSW